jgi:RNA polymerase sigma-70 factor (ECF subfamily)
MNLADNELVLKAQKGDQSAFEELVCRYDRRVLGLIMNFVNNHEEAQDLYQEVFLRVYKGLSKFRFQSLFSTWLYRITTNVCLTHRTSNPAGKWVSIEQDFTEMRESPEGKSWNKPIPEELTSQSDSDQKTYSDQISYRIQKALRSLSNQQRLVFVLRHYEGCRLREIASILCCAEGTVKKHLFSANVRMRNELQELYAQR